MLIMSLLSRIFFLSFFEHYVLWQEPFMKKEPLLRSMAQGVHIIFCSLIYFVGNFLIVCGNWMVRCNTIDANAGRFKETAGGRRWRNWGGGPWKLLGVKAKNDAGLALEAQCCRYWADLVPCVPTSMCLHTKLCINHDLLIVHGSFGFNLYTFVQMYRNFTSI